MSLAAERHDPAGPRSLPTIRGGWALRPESEGSIGERCGEEPLGPVLDEGAGVGEDHVDLGVADLKAGEHVGSLGSCSGLRATRNPEPRNHAAAAWY